MPVLIRLTVLEPGARPRTLLVAEEIARIGRDPGNDIVVRDSYVSGRHGEVRADGAGQVSFRDLVSTNGSRVLRGDHVETLDERAGRRAILRSGDVLLLGDSTRPVRLTVEILEAVPLTPETTVGLGVGGPAVVEEHGQVARVRDELDVTRHERLAAMPSAFDREALLALHRLTTRMMKGLGQTELLEAFAEHVLEAFPRATHVSVFVLEDGDFREGAARSRLGPCDARPLSRTIRDAVLDRRSAVSLEWRDPEMRASESLHDASARAVICAPLWTGERIVGLVQVDRRGVTAERFGRGDLETLVVFAQQAAMALENASLHAGLERACEESIRGLARALEASDRYTHGHSEAVAALCARVAVHAGLPAEEVETIRRAALLHDIGKIGIPGGVLNKADRLTPEEFRLLKTHPETGARILEPFSFLAPLLPIVKHHHERYDGRGYPSGLAGDEIPRGARLLAVVDTYHALVHDRAYRRGVGMEVALDELTRCKGSQFDPALVDALAAVVTSHADDVTDPARLAEAQTVD